VLPRTDIGGEDLDAGVPGLNHLGQFGWIADWIERSCVHCTKLISDVVPPNKATG
jgi:hypothetical protein